MRADPQARFQKAACESSLCHVEFGVSTGTHRKENAEQTVGNIDHSNEKIQTGAWRYGTCL